jgi:chaperone protein EcpD
MVFALQFSTANASVVIDGTRVVYPVKNAEVTVRLNNKGTMPKLVQAWIDDGDEKSSPEKIDVPFVILTPIFRMEPNKSQVLRIRYTQSKPVPLDRESVYWLNVLEIPAKPSGDQKIDNYLQFAFRTRIKVFLRPDGLPGTAAAAPESLIWKHKADGLLVTNPSAYNVSLKRVLVGANGEGGVVENVMLAPMSTIPIKLGDTKIKTNSPEIIFYPVNDFGGTPEQKSHSVETTF